MFLPGKVLLRRGAPEQMDLFLPLHKFGNHFRAMIFKRLTHRNRHGRGFHLFGKFRQRAQEHLGILHISHTALIIMHLLEISFGIILQNWIHDLNHVPKLLERDPEPVNGCRLQRLNLTKCLHGPRISLIYH